MSTPILNQLNLVVQDMEKSIAFYRLIGVDIPESAIWRTSTGAHHVQVRMPSGFELELDSPARPRSTTPDGAQAATPAAAS